MEFSKYSASGIKLDPHVFFLVENASRLKERLCLLHFFAACDRPTIIGVPPELVGDQYIRITGKPQELAYLSDMYTVYLNKESILKKKYTSNYRTLYRAEKDSIIYGVWRHPNDNTVAVLIKLQENGLQPIYRVQDRFMLEKGMIVSYTDSKPALTDVGKFVLNQVVLANSVGDKIPYINGRVDPSVTDDMIAKLIVQKKIGRKEYNAYINAGFWLGEEGSLFVPCWSEKSMGTDPKILKKKNELLAALKGDYDPTRIVEIEQELIAMDKEYLKDDASMAYWKAIGNKAFNEERKKSWIMFGLTPSFGETGKYMFVENSLQEGWNKENVTEAANDIRRGSYGRGKETAKGGEQTKYILRIFQNVSIAEDDCGTKKGLPVLLTESNYKQYDQRFLMNGKVTDIPFLKANIGKVITIRSPMYCKTKGFDYCAKCCGEILREIGMEAAGMQALDLTGTFTAIAMASIHKSGVTIAEVDDVSPFIVQSKK